MAWIEKRGKKYLVRWREPDGTSASEAVPDRTTARRRKAEVEGDLLRGTYTSKERREQPFAAYAADVLASSLRLKDSTRYAYERILRKHLNPVLGQVPIGEVDEALVRRLFARLEPPTAATQARVKQVLSRVLNQAFREGLLARNPIHAVDVAPVRRREITVLSPEEVEALAGAIDPRFRALVLLAAWGGLRVGELGALRPEDIDHYRSVVHVRQALSEAGGHITVGAPKTRGSKRTVAVPRFVMAELAKHQLAYPHPERVFTMPSGYWVTHQTLWPFWKAARDAVGVQARFHDLRHTAVALAIRQGAHPKAIQSRMGHATITMTMDTYGHLFPGVDEDLARGLEAFEPQGVRVVHLTGEAQDAGELLRGDVQVDGA